MLNETIETSARTTGDGNLNLHLKIGAPDTEVAVLVQVRAVSAAAQDANGWPLGYFARAWRARCRN
jgi:hypothetical protein